MNPDTFRMLAKPVVIGDGPYRVVQAGTLEGLVSKVDELSREGFEPVGSLESHSWTETLSYYTPCKVRAWRHRQPMALKRATGPED